MIADVANVSGCVVGSVNELDRTSFRSTGSHRFICRLCTSWAHLPRSPAESSIRPRITHIAAISLRLRSSTLHSHQ
jgi:hypothetical protein